MSAPAYTLEEEEGKQTTQIPRYMATRLWTKGKSTTLSRASNSFSATKGKGARIPYFCIYMLYLS